MTEFYETVQEAFSEPFEPNTPCRVMETRACVEVTTVETQRYKIHECKPGECNRFPNRDKRELSE